MTYAINRTKILRNDQIQIMRMEGHTLEEIGKAFSITRQRVNQILASFDMPDLMGGMLRPPPA